VHAVLLKPIRNSTPTIAILQLAVELSRSLLKF
jgi:hypothetical protein